MGGRDVKAFQRCVGRIPGEGKSQEGLGRGAGLNRLCFSTDSRGEQSLEVEAPSLGAGNCRVAVQKRQEGTRPE